MRSEFRGRAIRHVAPAVVGAAMLLAPGAAVAQNVYVANNTSNTVSVFNSVTNTAVGSPITVTAPVRDATTPDGS